MNIRNKVDEGLVKGTAFQPGNAPRRVTGGEGIRPDPVEGFRGIDDNLPRRERFGNTGYPIRIFQKGLKFKKSDRVFP